MTDVSAAGLNRVYVAGHFNQTSTRDFGANPLMAAAQRFKAKPIPDLSGVGSQNEAVF